MNKLLRLPFLYIVVLVLLTNSSCRSYLNWLKANAQNDIVFVKPDQSIDGHKIFTGTITPSLPVNETDAATKEYVDELRTMVNSLTKKVAALESADSSFMESLKRGDKVLTIGGIFGRVYEVKKNYITMDVGQDIKLKVSKKAVR